MQRNWKILFIVWVVALALALGRPPVLAQPKQAQMLGLQPSPRPTLTLLPRPPVATSVITPPAPTETPQPESPSEPEPRPTALPTPQTLPITGGSPGVTLMLLGGGLALALAALLGKMVQRNN